MLQIKFPFICSMQPDLPRSRYTFENIAIPKIGGDQSHPSHLSWIRPLIVHMNTRPTSRVTIGFRTRGRMFTRQTRLSIHIVILTIRPSPQHSKVTTLTSNVDTQFDIMYNTYFSGPGYVDLLEVCLLTFLSSKPLFVMTMCVVMQVYEFTSHHYYIDSN